MLLMSLICISVTSFAQNAGSRLVTGVVKDQKGVLQKNITLTEKGTKNATATDAEGAFSISVHENAILVFSGVGFETQEVKVSANTSITVVLKDDMKALNEVVIVGYGSQKKAKVTDAVSTVKMSEVLGERPVSTTATLLQGVVPGLQVTIPSGRPGETASLNIRGATDFGSSPTGTINTGQPLILVDNTVFDGPLNLIDPNDIETVSVLKDAGAAAIYGSRSAYGVILIQTKKGAKNQKTQFNFSSNFVLATPSDLPVKASPQRSLQALIDGGLVNYSVGQGQDLNKWIQLIDDYQKDPAKYPGGYTTDNGILYNLKANDAVGDLLGNRSTQFMNNFSVNGGSEKTTYRISLGTTNENGIMVPSAHVDNFTRYNVRTVVGTDLTKWMNLSLDANYVYSNTIRPGYSDPYTYAVRIPSYLFADSIPGYTGQVSTGKNLVTNSYPTNFRNDLLRMLGRVVLKPFSGMTVTGETSYDNFHGLTTSYNKLFYLRDPYGWANMPYGNDQFQKANASQDYITTNVYANYTKSLGLHNFSLMAGFNQEYKNYEQEILQATQPINPAIPSITTSTGTISGTDNYLQFATRGYFGRFNYDYDEKYLLEVNGRYDGSSRFPEGNRWGFFPSASAGWRVTNEKFMDFIKPYVNEFRLRASYGSVGNQNIGEYQYIAAMYATNPSWLNTGSAVTTLTTPGLISPDFTWETVNTLDYGVTVGLLKNKLTGSFDYYIRNTNGILSTNNTPVPAVLGTSAPLINSASLKSNGFEIEVNWRDKIGKVAYFVSANLYDFTSIVTKVNNPNKLLVNASGDRMLYQGEKMGEIWGYTTNGFFTTNDFVPGTLDPKLLNGTLNPGVPKIGTQSPNPGDIKYVDFNKDGVISAGASTVANPGDQRIIGNNSLRYQYGLRGGVSLYNFDFSFVLAGVLKNDQFRNSYLFFPNTYQIYGALYDNQLNYWTPANQNAYFGRIYTNGLSQGNNQVVQSRFILNGAYLRVRNLTLAYNLPQSLLNKWNIKKLAFNCSVENPFIFDHMPKGMYPDINDLGAGLGYPLLLKTSFGLTLGF
jgi:TonB-linked SusC/RagA family outer membrane protein